MAMVKTDGTVTEIEGKIGGDIWRKDVCGQHVQAYPRDVSNEPSPAQKRRRRAWNKLMSYVRRFSTVYFAQCWQQYANLHPRKSKKGKVIILTWWQQFISLNINSVTEGKPITPLPPGYPPE